MNYNELVLSLLLLLLFKSTQTFSNLSVSTNRVSVGSDKHVNNNNNNNNKKPFEMSKKNFPYSNFLNQMQIELAEEFKNNISLYNKTYSTIFKSIQSMETKFSNQPDYIYEYSTPYYSDSSVASYPGESEEDINSERNFQLILSIIVGIIYTITVIVGLVGNLLVVLTILLHKQMRNSTNILILNLAIADLTFIVICVPFTGLNYVLSIWYFGDFWCKLVQYTSNVTAYASVLLLVLMSVDRYLAIVKPYTSISYRNQTNTFYVVLILWILILIANIPHLFLWMNYQYTYASNHRTVCILKYHVIKNEAYATNQTNIIFDSENKIRTYYLTFFLFAYILPCISLIILYGLIMYKLKDSKGQQVSKGKRKVTCMVIAVVSCFVLCWSPLQIMLFLQHVVGKEFNKTEVVTLVISNGIGYFNSCLNPIIYGFSNSEFKKAYSNILACRWQNNSYVGVRTNRGANITCATTTTTVKTTLREIKLKNGSSNSNSNSNSKTKSKSRSKSKESKKDSQIQNIPTATATTINLVPDVSNP